MPKYKVEAGCKVVYSIIIDAEESLTEEAAIDIARHISFDDWEETFTAEHYTAKEDDDV